MMMRLACSWFLAAIGITSGLLRSGPDVRITPKDSVDAKLKALGGPSGHGVPNMAPASQQNASLTNRKRRQLVVAKYGEDVSWLNKLPKIIDVVVYQSKERTDPHYVENYGNEASKYLQYILEHYDDLPEYLAFVQAGRQDWHDPLPKDNALASWDWLSPLRSDGIAYLPTKAPCSIEDSSGGHAPEDSSEGGGDNASLWEQKSSQMEAVREAWPEVFEEELGPLPKRWVTQCCAQFEVTRAAVRQHPKAFYQQLFDWVMRHDKALFAQRAAGTSSHDAQRRDAGHVLEATWVLIFSQPMAKVVLPS